jgi:hypothetical protein
MKINAALAMKISLIITSFLRPYMSHRITDVDNRYEIIELRNKVFNNNQNTS